MKSRRLLYLLLILSFSMGSILAGSARGQQTSGGVIPQPHLALVSANVVDVRTGGVTSL